MLQPENGILIKNFYDDKNDCELLNLIPFLEFMSDVYDIRDVREYYTLYNEFKQPIPYLSMDKTKKIWDPKQSYYSNIQKYMKKDDDDVNDSQ